MKSGANYIVIYRMGLDIEAVEDVIFTFKASKTITKKYPDDVNYENGMFTIPLYQKDTIDLEGNVLTEAQINYKSGAISKTEVGQLYISTSIATELVPNDNPSMTNIADVHFEMVGNAIIASMDADPEDVAKAVEEYLKEHPVEAGISADECLEIMTQFYYEHYESLVGPQGPAGPQGEKGEKGDRGNDGERGERGETGPQGERGEQGVPGIQGPVGPAGADGVDGSDGADGRDGSDGFSPIANVSRIDDGAFISITDRNGTTTAVVRDGQGGGGDVPENVAVTDMNNNFSASQTINGTLTVNGDIVQNGASYEAHAEHLYTTNDVIITRDGAVGGLAEDEYTGIKAKKYDGTNDGVLAFGADGVARVGDENDTQPILTRAEATDLKDGQLLKWDETQNKAVGTLPMASTNIYSLEETMIGQYMDGKPLYRRCFRTVVPTTATSGTNVGTSIVDTVTFNVDNVVNLGGMMNDTNKEMIPSVVPSGSTIALVRVYLSGTVLTITNNYKNFSGREAIVYIEYTKTTDTPQETMVIYDGSEVAF